jgi:hypothetical protein
MDKKLTNTLKYGLWIAVAALLLYFSFRNVNWKDFGVALRECHWGYVVLSMVLGAAAFLFRSLRWRMQLQPLDASTSRITTWNAFNICTITNFVLPRVGEIVRCGYVVRHSGRDGEGKRLVTFDKALGTVVADRMWDVISLGAVFVVLLVVLYNRFGSFITDTIFQGIAGKVRLWWLLVLGVLLAVGFVYLCWRLRDRAGIWGRFWGWIRGIYDGLVSCLHMRNGWLFILYTVLIWMLYWLMSASILWALQGIDPSSVSPELAASLAKVDGLGMDDALLLMVAGALSSLIPVPGGFGAFHGAVALALSSVYGIPFEVGLIFATLSHESQVITDILCGGASYLHETFFRR